MIGVGIGQSLGDVSNLRHRQRRVKPDMRVHHFAFMIMIVVVVVVVMIVFAYAGQHLNALACVDDRQIFSQGHHLVHELLHPAAVDDQRIRALQRHHVARLKLIVMQAADILLRHILYGHAVNACRNILRQNIHRVERGDDYLLPIRLRCASAEQQRQNHHQQRKSVSFFHGFSFPIFQRGQIPRICTVQAYRYKFSFSF